MNFSYSLPIAASPETVFALSSDLDRWPQVIKAIVRVEKITPGPVGVGTRFKETRTMFGRESTEEMTFAAFDPPHSYTLEMNASGCLFRNTFHVAPHEGGSLLTLSFESKALSFFGKLMSPLLKLMAGQMKKCIQGDMNDLKTALEAPPRT